MSTLANEALLESIYEESFDELGINENSLFYPNACKIAEQMAMEKFLSNNP